jgi:hypothetical protein
MNRKLPNCIAGPEIECEAAPKRERIPCYPVPIQPPEPRSRERVLRSRKRPPSGGSDIQRKNLSEESSTSSGRMKRFTSPILPRGHKQPNCRRAARAGAGRMALHLPERGEGAAPTTSGKGDPMPVHPEWSDLAVRLLCAGLAGLVIGLDRDEHGRPAGLRTTMLVCLAACIAMIQANLLLVCHCDRIMLRRRADCAGISGIRDGRPRSIGIEISSTPYQTGSRGNAGCRRDSWRPHRAGNTRERYGGALQGSWLLRGL